MSGESDRVWRAAAEAILRALTPRSRRRVRGDKGRANGEARPERPRRPSRTEKSPAEAPPLTRAYPGDVTYPVDITYRPDANGEPDTGEVVWTWVPYEDDPREGKDRPVLLIARDGDWLVGLMLTSKDHHRDAADEARYGRLWMDLGTGDWDSKRRPSEVRIDRLIRVDPRAVRREGAILDRKRFDDVVRSLRNLKHW